MLTRILFEQFFVILKHKLKLTLMNLKEYSLLAAGILAASDANNQTVYQDINPDLSLTHDDQIWFNISTPLDLNNDGVTDFDFKLWGYSTYSGWAAQGYFIFGYAVPKAGNQVLIASSQSPGFCTFGWFAENFDHIANYSNGEIINPTPATGAFVHPENEFYNNQLLFMQREKDYFASTWYFFCTGVPDPVEQGGLWFDAEMRVMPIKFKQSGNFYTGWVRLSVSEGNLTVHDYAINLTPETPMVAGDIAGAIIAQAPVPGLVTTLSTKAYLTWSPVPDVYKYRYRYRKVGTLIWTEKYHTGTTKLIKSLDCASNYEWQVQTVYDNSPEMNSVWSPMHTFSTMSCRVGGEDVLVEDVKIYPTLASTQIIVQTTSQSQTVDAIVEMFNLQGAQVKSFVTNDKTFEMDVHDLPTGTYVVVVHIGDDEPVIEKVMIGR
jgi:hypothetical protein